MFFRGRVIVWFLVHIIPFAISLFVGMSLFPGCSATLTCGDPNASNNVLPGLAVWLVLGYVLAVVQDKLVQILRGGR